MLYKKIEKANFWEYDKKIPRVSDLISHKYPFEWNSKARYLDWLKANSIEEDEYLSGAQELWTAVHDALENYLLQKDFISTVETIKEIDNWIEWLKELAYKEILTEVFLKDKDNRFNWTCDLLYQTQDWKIILGDYKTYWIVKKRYWLPNKFQVPPDKRKKVQLQLSIYAYVLKQIWIEVDTLQLIFIHEEWVKTWEFTPIPDSEIEELIKAFQNSLEFVTF